MFDLFEDRAQKQEKAPMQEAPSSLWQSEVQPASHSNCESRLFNPNPTFKPDVLPNLQIGEAQTLRSSDISSMVSNIARNLANDAKFGAPNTQAGDVSRSGGLIDYIHFPNNSETLQYNYDDRSTGRVSDISMGGKQVSFLYDGDKISSILFSGGNGTRPQINFDVYGEGTARTSDGRQISVDRNQLGYEIFNHLRGN